VGRNRGGAAVYFNLPGGLQRRASALLVHAEGRFLVLASDVVKVNVGRDAAVVIGTVKPPPHGNIKLPNLSFTVELAHGLLLLTCAASPRRSTETSGQGSSGYETLKYYT
jgi:hypothetical protein